MTNTATRLPSPSPALRMLLWCLAGSGLVHYILSAPNADLPKGFSLIFWYLFKTLDPEANLLLMSIAVCAFALRGRAAVLAAVRFCAQAPWIVAAAMFVLLCLGSVYGYHNHPLSADEYSAVFQAEVFASGQLAGAFPRELLDQLIPKDWQNYFFAFSRTTGAVSSTYWPGFAILLTPFVWLGIPWAANPAIGALSIAAIHRLARAIAGPGEAAGWAVALTIASPVFIASSISYYAMQAHFLANIVYALLLLRPTVPRAVGAGLIGSFALALHQPIPHLAFAFPFVFWLCIRGGSLRVLAVLILSYIPLSLLLGFGWKYHLNSLVDTPISSGAGQHGQAMFDVLLRHLRAAFGLSALSMAEVRIAWLAKVWTWGTPGLVVLAGFGLWAAVRSAELRLLCASLALTFLVYCLAPFDQGHGWGSRYLHSAWFALPILAAIALTSVSSCQAKSLRIMAAWACALSFVLANGLRIAQIENFIDRQLAQVPPLRQPAVSERTELVFVNTRHGFYSVDLIQNDPFLGDARIILVQRSPELDDALVARSFPGYVKATAGSWGEHWISMQSRPAL